MKNILIWRKRFMISPLACRIISSVLLPCFFLYSIRCGPTVPSTPPVVDIATADRSQPIIVLTKDGLNHMLLKWEQDERGDISGAGSTFESLRDLQSGKLGSPFNGIILASNIALVYDGSDLEIRSEIKTEAQTLVFLLVLAGVVLLVWLLISTTTKGIKGCKDELSEKT